MMYSAQIAITNQHNGLFNYLESLKKTRDRSRVNVAEDPETVRITVEAADTASFRGAINAITQTLSVFETIKNV